METQFDLLSPTQKSIWIKQSLYPDSVLFNLGGYRELKGAKLDVNLFFKAYTILLENSDNLAQAGAFNKQRSPVDLFSCQFFDFSKESDPVNSVLSWMDADMTKPINFPEHCIQVKLGKINEEYYFMYLKAHHMVMDGFAFKLLCDKSSAIYHNLCEHGSPLLVEEHHKFTDFVIEQKEYGKSSAYLQEKKFWKQKLSEAKWGRGFETLMQPVEEGKFNAVRKNIKIPRGVYSRIEEFCVENNCSTFHYFMAAILMVNKLYGNESSMLGLPVFNRNSKKYKNTTGVFITMLPFYHPISDDISFVDFLNSIKKELRSYYRNQKFPIIDLHDELKLGRNYFNVLFSYQKIHHNNELFGIPSSDTFYLHSGEQEEDLGFHLLEYTDENDLVFSIDYKTNLFTEETISKLELNFSFLFQHLLTCKDQLLGNISLLSSEEKDLILNTFNNTKKTITNKSFIELFNAQVLLVPENNAVIYRNKTLSYSELDRVSNQLANYLVQNFQIQKDDLVGLQLGRTEWVIVAILAIYKSGAAYIPIDPAYPQDRIEFIKANAKCKGVICENEIQLFLKDKDDYSQKGLSIISSPSDLAYVIYTSGSTGQPKGSMIEQAGMVNHLLAMADTLQLNSKSKIAQNASFTFDISVWQLLNALITGGTTFVYDNETILDPEVFMNALEKDEVNILQVVPSYLKALLEIAVLKNITYFDQLQYLLVTGEAVNQPLLKLWFDMFPGTKVVNAYGPAEASDDVTLYFMNEAPSETNVPVGKPIQNIKIYILNNAGTLCPIGMEGEIYVSGIGVGRGYLNDEERTKASFLTDPFETGEPVRMYKTGDIGRWRADGNIEYIGRKDDQVKIRGYRIELGEIENALLQYPQIREAVVVAWQDSLEEKRLVAYITVSDNIQIDELRSCLYTKIPQYMVPSFFTILDQLPLNSNGKVNKKVLPLPNERESTGTKEFTAPRKEIEKKLAEIWSEVLGIEKIGIHDSFFELGGHSLKLIRVLSKIHEQFDVKMEMNVFFKYPEIEFVAQYLEAVNFVNTEKTESNEELIF